MRKDHLADRRPLFLGTILTLVAVLVAAVASPAAADCSGAAALTLDDTRRDSGSDLLKVTVSTAGILTLDVSSPAAGVQPKVVFLGTTSTCTGAAGEGTDFDYVNQTPEWLALDVYTDTTYYLEVKPQDSQQTLGDYKLRVTWVSDPSTPNEENDLSPDATDTCSASSTAMSANNLAADRFLTVSESTDQWDDDIMKGSVTTAGVLVVENQDTTGPDLAASLYASTSCGAASEVGSAVFSGSSGRIAAVVYPADHALALASYGSSNGAYEVSVKLFAPCDQGETDDHGDASLCATAIDLDGSDTGQVDNVDGDDEDFFSFVLSAQTSVEVLTTGSTDTYGSLYDEDGQRLDSDDDSGTDYNFRIARTLGAGRYFVRVEGASGAEGSYGLEVNETP